MKDQSKHTQLEVLQNFEFAKTPVMAAKVHTGEMIALRPCVENLGLNWSGALQAIKRNDFYSQLCVSVKAIGADGKKYEMICLPPTAFQEWLWNLNPKSEKFNVALWEEYKKGLVLYLLMMLKISLDEVKRLRRIEAMYKEQKSLIMSILSMDDEALDARRRGAVRRRQKIVMLERLRNSHFTDPDQLNLDDQL
jgi:hypothetical protein